MMKFFRKYNKQLLAVFAVGLMIVFLGGSALYELAAPSVDRVVATSNLGDITYLNQEAANGATDFLARIQLNWQLPVPEARTPLQTTDWVLLTRETEAFGLRLDESAIRATLPLDLRVDELSRSFRVQPDFILSAIAQLESIRRVARIVGASTTPSEAELLSASRRCLEKVRLNAVVLPAAAFQPEEATFTQAELDAQFNKYKSRERMAGLGFGYFVPSAIKLQYVKIDRDELAGQLHVPNLNRRAKRYYDDRPQQPAFARPREDTPDEEVEGPQPERKPYLSWEEAKDIAVDLVRKQEADKLAVRIADWVIRFASESWLGIPREDDGYRAAPKEIKSSEYYAEVLKKLPKSLAYGDAFSTGATPFVDPQGAQDIPGLGTAWFRPQRGGMGISLITLAFLSKPIVPSVPDDAQSANQYLSLLETCRYPLTDSDGNVYAFRVAEGRDGHAAESIAEVRELVETDLRLLQGLEEAKWHAISLENCEQDDMTLKEAYESNIDLADLAGTSKGARIGYFEPEPLSRASQYQAASGQVVSTRYVGAGIGSVSSDVVEQCFALNEHDRRYAVIEMKDTASLLVVEWVETLGARDDEFQDMRATFVQQMASARAREAIAQWLDPENIRARTGFQLVTR